MKKINRLEELFEQAVEDWIKHCSQPKVLTSSYSDVVRDCEPYRLIVSMGKKALPLIRKLYERDGDISFQVIRGHGLAYAVREIVGEEFQIPKEIAGKIEQIEKYTADWLDKNMNRY